jgi:hypothetical protein
VWQAAYGEHEERLRKAAERGKDVPALRSKPEIFLWLLPALDCWADLDGAVTWDRVKEWAVHYQVDLEWLFPVLRQASAALAAHKAAQKGASRGNKPARRHQ